MSRKGFTLAEILLVLAIIGVIAAVTIPVLIREYQKNQDITGLRKAYNTFNQVLQRISIDKDCTNDLVCAGLFADGTDNKTLGGEIVNYLKVYKNCGIATGRGCWPGSTNQYYDGSSNNNYTFDNESYYKFITTDGASFALYNYATDGKDSCKLDWSTPPPQKLGYMSQTCGEIYIDVNGLKGPNRMGRDTFWFFITNGKGALLYPGGGMDDNDNLSNTWWNRNDENNCSPSGSKFGYFCAGRIIEKGWMMDY